MDQWRPLTLVLCIATYFLLEVQADCCDRNGPFCCGKGDCNIFCCNCDDGCDRGCETTSCGWQTWVQCINIVLNCVVPCSQLPDDVEQCIACMGSLYDTCKDCIVPENELMRSAPPASMTRLQFFKSLDKDNSAGVSEVEFNDFKLVSHASFQQRSARGNDECWEHRGWDTDGDGQINFDEFNTSRCMRQQPAAADGDAIGRSGGRSTAPAAIERGATRHGSVCAYGQPAVVINVGCPNTAIA